MAKHAPAVGATVKRSMDASLNSGVSCRNYFFFKSKDNGVKLLGKNVYNVVLRCMYFFQAFSKYYKGGFEAKMSKREAGLILGVR